MSEQADISSVRAGTPRWIFAPFLIACLIISVLAGLQWLDRKYPLDLGKLAKVSFVVEDRNGKLLRGFANRDGRWRLPVEISDVDPRFINMLLAYEDKRFYRHYGVDVFALARSAGQVLVNGRIVSGGSTLTMQVARLLEGPTQRSLLVKLRQIGRAVQIERRLSKAEILSAYLHLAPYGGNLEGVRAASLAYFGKEPKVLSVGQAALLVALPQSPETRRPDRFLKRATSARNRVLARMVLKGVLGKADGERAGLTVVNANRKALPAFAAHLSEQAQRRLKRRSKSADVWRTTINRDMQATIERLVADRVNAMGKRDSIAVLVADHRSGEILAQVASPDFFNQRRAGEVDMINALRSPGSTLKPFIYGLAFEEGIVHPASLIDDLPVDFAGYRPRNFDLGYQGTVDVERALQLSLNIPAIKLLNAVGPDKLLARFRRAGVKVKLPDHESVGLAVGLGGLGISLRDLVQLYSALPNGGKAVQLVDGITGLPEVKPLSLPRSMSRVASWYVQQALVGVSAPQGAGDSAHIAYKTGTSYGYRDAWSVGFDGRYVIGVWVGRPDGASVPGITGRGVAAPILYEAFGRLAGGLHQLPKVPEGVLALGNRHLPQGLKRFTPRGTLVRHSMRSGKAPRIVFPRSDVRVDLGLSSGGERSPLFIKIQDGTAPFRWLANGKPILARELRRQVQWHPDSAGFSTLTVLDAVGRVARVRVFVE